MPMHEMRHRGKSPLTESYTLSGYRRLPQAPNGGHKQDDTESSQRPDRQRPIGGAGSQRRRQVGLRHLFYGRAGQHRIGNPIAQDERGVRVRAGIPRNRWIDDTPREFEVVITWPLADGLGHFQRDLVLGVRIQMQDSRFLGLDEPGDLRHIGAIARLLSAAMDHALRR